MHFRENKSVVPLFTLASSEFGTLSIFVGDFNTTVNRHEKQGGLTVIDPFQEKMEDLISQEKLIDIKPRGLKCTWSNKHVDPCDIVAILYRFLIFYNHL